MYDKIEEINGSKMEIYLRLNDHKKYIKKYKKEMDEMTTMTEKIIEENKNL